MKPILHRKESDPYNFYLGDEVFKPHGINRWVFDKKGSANALSPKEFLLRMAEAGINTLRMVVPGEYERGVEPELGKYNPDFLKSTDEVFGIAEELEIYIVLCLFDYASFYAPWMENAWQYGIYSTKFPHHKDFFGSRELRKYEKGRLEFLVDHFRRYSNIFAWELMNEMNYLGKDYGDTCEAVTMEWFDDMARFVRGIEPQHMTTASLSGGETWDSLYSHPFNDFVQVHTYDEELNPKKIAEVIRGYIQKTRHYGKPVVVSEFASKKQNPERAKFVESALRAAQEEGSSAWLYASVWDSDAKFGMGHGDMDEELFKVYKDTRPISFRTAYLPIP